MSSISGKNELRRGLGWGLAVCKTDLLRFGREKTVDKEAKVVLRIALWILGKKSCAYDANLRFSLGTGGEAVFIFIFLM